MSDNAGPAPKIEDEAVPEAEDTIRFDDPDPNTHDVVINVKGQKFYCVKMTLAKHSPHCYDSFFKDPKHTSQKEVFMILHGVNKSNDDVVSRVLWMSKLWDCGVALQQCVDFLGKSWKLSIKEKFDAIRRMDGYEECKQYFKCTHMTWDEYGNNQGVCDHVGTFGELSEHFARHTKQYRIRCKNCEKKFVEEGFYFLHLNNKNECQEEHRSEIRNSAQSVRVVWKSRNNYILASTKEEYDEFIADKASKTVVWRSISA